MLIFSREKNETVTLELEDGRRIEIVVTRIGRNVVRLGFEAPSGIRIHRGEVQAAIDSAS